MGVLSFSKSRGAGSILGGVNMLYPRAGNVIRIASVDSPV